MSCDSLSMSGGCCVSPEAKDSLDFTAQLIKVDSKELNESLTTRTMQARGTVIKWVYNNNTIGF